MLSKKLKKLGKSLQILNPNLKQKVVISYMSKHMEFHLKKMGKYMLF